jgi:hypothetical protein
MRLAWFESLAVASQPLQLRRAETDLMAFHPILLSGAQQKVRGSDHVIVITWDACAAHRYVKGLTVCCGFG